MAIVDDKMGRVWLLRWSRDQMKAVGSGKDTVNQKFSDGLGILHVRRVTSMFIL